MTRGDEGEADASRRVFHAFSGRELAALRRAAGLTQAALARAAGVGRHSVSYWETRAVVDRYSWAPCRMLAALGVVAVPCFGSSTRAWGDGVLDDAHHADAERELARALEREAARKLVRAAAAKARLRLSCEARTRKGRPCRLLSEPGRRRCKFHGGCSTGPRTPEGRARVAEAQRRRWARWRAERTP